MRICVENECESTTKSERTVRCEPCRLSRKAAQARKGTAKYRAANPDKIKVNNDRSNKRNRESGYTKRWHADIGHWRTVERKFGVTQEWYCQTLAEQGGVCAICSSSDPGAKGKFSIDHDHVTGRVRALLCANCNVGIGFFNDDANRVERAAAYLRTHSTHRERVVA